LLGLASVGFMRFAREMHLKQSPPWILRDCIWGLYRVLCFTTGRFSLHWLHSICDWEIWFCVSPRSCSTRGYSGVSDPAHLKSCQRQAYAEIG
jgi:hypothetical protein